MKNTTMITMAALLLGSSGLMAQTTTAFTKPSGFVTHTLKAGQFNLIGLTLHEAVSVSGKFSAVSGTTLTDANVDFDTTLTAGKTYILEITSGALEGTIQEIAPGSWSGNTITTTADLDVDGLAVDDTYQMRDAATLASVFGLNNEAKLAEGGHVGEADVIWVPNLQGGFDTFFYSSGVGFGAPPEGWATASGQPAPTKILVYTDALYIQSPVTVADHDLVLTGTVKTKLTALGVGNGFNYVSSTYPVGTTLGNSGLESSLTTGGHIGEADVIWMPNSSGGFDTFFYSSGVGFGAPPEGWVTSSGVSSTDVPVTSGFIIQRHGDGVNVKITPPSGYGDL